MLTGYGSVWLERAAGGREVAGSNPVTPIFALLFIRKVLNKTGIAGERWLFLSYRKRCVKFVRQAFWISAHWREGEYSMKAVVYQENGKIGMEERPVPKPGRK